MIRIDIAGKSYEEVGDEVAQVLGDKIMTLTEEQLYMLSAHYVASIYGIAFAGMRKGKPSQAVVAARAVDLAERTFGVELYDSGAEGDSAQAAG